MTNRSAAPQKTGRTSSMRTRRRDPAERVMNQMRALAKGKTIVMTIENPNKNETKMRFVKVRVSPQKKTS